MSEAITLDAPAPGQRATTEHQPAATVTEPVATIENGDADALRQTQEALAKTQKERDDALRAAQTAGSTARTAQSEAARLRDEAARATTGRVAERKVALAQTVQAAKSELSQAQASFVAAGEAGDYKAQAEAQALIASAMYRGSNAEAELAQMGDGTKEPPRTESQRTREPQEHVPGPRARQWLNDHPEMETNPDFRDVALLAHNQAVRRGFAPETDQYFDHINRAVAGFKPQEQTQRTQEPPAMSRTDPPAAPSHTSQGAPSNRGGSGSGLPAGWKPVSLNGLGTVNAQDLPGGGMRFNFPDPTTYENMEEGAKVCYPDEYQKDAKGATAKYTREQVIISRERAAGGTGGLTVGDGSTYR